MGQVYRRPRSTCIVHSSFTTTSRANANKSWDAVPDGALGRVSVTFKRGGKGTYNFNRPMKKSFWMQWMRAASKGRFFNDNIRGRF